MGLHIERAQSVTHPALLALLEESQGLPLAHLPRFAPQKAARLQADTILDKAAHNATALLAAFDNERLVGVLLLEELPWDSAQYGMAMGRISALHTAPETTMEVAGQLVSAALRFCREQGWRYMDFQPPAGDLSGLNAALSLGFRLVASTLALVWELDTPLPTPPASPASLRIATPKDADLVAALAARAIDPYSRFASDPQLKPGKAGDIFGAWAANSVKGYADRVFLAELDDELVGYCTWKIHAQGRRHFDLHHANLDLTAVAPEARGRHILSALMHAGLAWLQGEGFNSAEVVTHILNGPMQRAAHRYGATTRAARHNLHWHA